MMKMIEFALGGCSSQAFVDANPDAPIGDHVAEALALHEERGMLTQEDAAHVEAFALFLMQNQPPPTQEATE